jgi:hypothetical protein
MIVQAPAIAPIRMRLEDLYRLGLLPRIRGGSISDYAENKILDAIFNNVALAVTTPFVSLHTADPGETGASEVAGGSYARQAGSFGAAASGDVTNDAQIEFTNMPAVGGNGVVAFGIFDAVSAGNALWFDWLGNFQWQKFTVQSSDLVGNTITAPGHGLSNDQRVVFTAEFGGDTLPTGIVAGTLYWVINAATDTFEISTTQGGAEVDITAVGKGSFRRVDPKTVNGGDAFRFASGQLTIRLR